MKRQTLDKAFSFISDAPSSKLIFATAKPEPVVGIKATVKKGPNPFGDAHVSLNELVDVMGYRALGKRLAVDDIKKVELLSFAAPALDADAPIIEDEPATDESDQPTLF